MAEPLVTYVDDHLDGARIALQLLEAMHDDDQQFRDFAGALLPEI